MPALRFSGLVLPEHDQRELYVVGGQVSYVPVADAELIATGWIVPGLVDAHCHIGLDDDGPVSEEEAERQALHDRDGGALLIRDAGSALDTTWMQARVDLPRLIRCGRHIARTGRYLRNYAHEVEPAELSGRVAREAQRSDGWVKLIGDWISREAGDLHPSFSASEFAEAIGVAHRHGAKVTAHCFGEEVLAGLIAAGIDCIEHGTGLTEDLIDAMVARGTAMVPTVMQVAKFPQYAAAGAVKFPAYSATMRNLHRRTRDTLMAAYEAGVPLFAGSDGGGVARHGNLAGEVIAMAELGMPAEYALGAASWRAREWLGWNPTLDERAPADFVVYDSNPLADLRVLRRPRCVVLRGRVVSRAA
ncbi:MAG: amidohydrolase family protein [Nocardioides sp.]